MRFVVSFFFFIVLGRWMYAEVNLNFPSALPYVDKALETIAIPTHDKWSESKLAQALAAVRGEQIEREQSEKKEPISAPASALPELTDQLERIRRAQGSFFGAILPSSETLERGELEALLEEL